MTQIVIFDDYRIRHPDDPVLVGDLVTNERGELRRIIAKRKVGNRYYLVTAPSTSPFVDPDTYYKDADGRYSSVLPCPRGSSHPG